MAHHPKETAMNPTDEQQTAIDLFTDGGSLAIEAVAGAGKSTALVMMAESAPKRRGYYMAYNKAVTLDIGGKLPGNCSASTIHSLAFRAIGNRYAHRLKTPRMKSQEIAKRLNIAPLTVDGPMEKKRLAAGYLGGLTMRALNNFCQSGDDAPTAQHFPYIEGIDMPTSDGRRTWMQNDIVRQHLLPALRRAWADFQNIDGALPFGHNYLKLWERDNPVIPADFILADEVQDLNGLALSVLAQQSHAQIVGVGDQNQCQPPETIVDRVIRAASGSHGPVTEKVRIDSLVVGDQVVSYDVARTHLYGNGQTIRSIVQRPFTGELVRVSTPDGRGSSYTLDHRCIVDPSSLAGRWAVYVMRSGEFYRIGACQWRYESQNKAAGFVVRGRQEKADAVWVLATFATKREATIYEFGIAGRFGIPTVTFLPVNSGSVLDAASLTAGWEMVGPNEDRAVRCLVEHGRDVDVPIWQKGQRFGTSRPREIHAANLLDGMLVTDGRGHWTPITVTRVAYNGPVVSLEVAGPATYVADGIVTHNSIYGWLGTLSAFDELEWDNRCHLTMSFRFGQTVADVANGLLARAGATIKVVGSPSILSTVGDVVDPACILTRTNAEAVRQFFDARAAGRAAHLVGGGSEVISFARAALDVKAGRWTSHQDLACFSNWGEVLEYVDHDEMGDELRLMVKLVDEFGAQTIISQLEEAVAEDGADVTISTAHKCVHPDTLVETPNGLERIGTLAESGRIATPFGEGDYVDKFVRSEATLLTIQTRRGYELTATEDHGVTVWRDGTHRRTVAADLAAGDWVRLRLGVTCDRIDEAPLPPPPAVLDVRSKVWRIPRQLTEDVAELLGLIVADGTVFAKGKGVRLAKRHMDVVDRFALLVKDAFGYDCTRGVSATAGATPLAEINSMQIGAWLLAVGGMAPKAKAIPDCVLRSPIRVQAAFLRGLFEDGTVNIKDGKVDHVHWENSNADVAATVQTMLLRMGIISTRKVRTSHGWPITSLYLYSSAVVAFAAQIGFVSAWKNDRLTNPIGSETRRLIPVTHAEVEDLDLAIYNRRNARAKGYITRAMAEKTVVAMGCRVPVWLIERMDWQYERVRSVTRSLGQSVCVEVPDGSRFLQNGFDGWNSKGRGFSSVKIAADFTMPKPKPTDPAGRDLGQEELRLAYVAVTRAMRELDLSDVPHFLANPNAAFVTTVEEAIRVRPAPVGVAEVVPAVVSPVDAGPRCCPDCLRTDVVRGGLIGVHRCTGITS